MFSGIQQQTVVTVTDPATGQQVQQVVQTVTDPKTGGTKQVVMMGGQACEVMTSQDPETGLPVQTIVQKDPVTGQPKMIQVTETKTTSPPMGTFFLLKMKEEYENAIQVTVKSLSSLFSLDFDKCMHWVFLMYIPKKSFMANTQLSFSCYL